jgi:hypothetical protein
LTKHVLSQGVRGGLSTKYPPDKLLHVMPTLNLLHRDAFVLHTARIQLSKD